MPVVTFARGAAPIASALLAGLLCAVPAAAQPDDVQAAAKLLRAGQHGQALEMVNKVLSAKPRDAQARFLKGLIYTEQGNTREAIETFQKLTQDYPALPEPYNNLAVIYAAQGQYERARAALEQSIRTHPSYATAYENLGDVYAKLASQAYDKALQIDSSNAGAQNKLALVRELVGGGTPVAAAKPPVKPVVVAAAPPAPKPEPAKPEAKPEPPRPEPVAVAKPVPAPAPPKPLTDPREEVLKAVQAWASAWEKQDVEAYLAAYARDFDPRGEQSHADWEKQRRARVGGPKSISITLGSPKVTVESEAAARVTFVQNYRSERFKGSSTKTLELVKSGGRWLIREERVGR